MSEAWRIRLATPVVLALSACLLTTTAGTNLMVFLLLLLAPWAWWRFEWVERERRQATTLFMLIGLFCIWDLSVNLWAGNSWLNSVKALRDLRNFGFIILLWPIFALPKVARRAAWGLLASVVLLALANLTLTLAGHVPQGSLMTKFMPNMHGQILVGLVLLLGMSWIEQPDRSWRAWLPMVILLLSLLLASSRRTGYILLVAGAGMALVLNRDKLRLQKYRVVVLLGVVVILGLALSSSHLRMRVSLALSEVVQFFSLDTRQRAALETSVAIRLEYYVSTWRLIQDHFWTGLGSLKFGDAFWQINQQMGATNKALFGGNPHNEYLWMWATKGLIGLIMYLAIWVQVCRMAWHKRDRLQRHGLWVLVTLFLISITSNSMSFDMVEGHFMMLALLIFLAPENLKLWPEKVKTQAQH